MWGCVSAEPGRPIVEDAQIVFIGDSIHNVTSDVIAETTPWVVVAIEVSSD